MKHPSCTKHYVLGYRLKTLITMTNNLRDISITCPNYMLEFRNTKSQVL